MKTTRNRIAIESSSAPVHPDYIAQGINSSETGINNRSNISMLFAKILMFCSLGLILLSSCTKNDDLTPLSDDNILNLKAEVAAYYIAPNGNDAANGDITHPFATLNKAWTKVVAGDLVYMRGGTYAFNSTQQLTNKNGTAGNLIKIWAYPGEIPVITKGTPFSYGSSAAGIQVGGVSFIHLKGLEITGFTQPNEPSVYPAIRVANTTDCIFELLNNHHNGHGMVMVGNEGTLDRNLVLNCDFHHNADPYSNTPYDNADGLEIAYTTTGVTNTVRGCRSWSNSDDGFDYWNSNGIINTENCWSFWNGYNDNGITLIGIGEGFKFGGPGLDDTPTTLKRTYSNCVAFGNSLNGFASNGSKCKVKLLNCTAYHNAQTGTAYLVGMKIDNTTTSQSIYSNCISYGNQWTNGGLNNRPVYLDPSSIVTTSSFIVDKYINPEFTVTDADFISVSPSGIDGPRQSDGSLPNLTFLHLATGSDLINKGVNAGLPYNGTAPDLGAFETGSTSSSNNAPTIQNQTFQLIANSANGTAVGTIIASDPDAGQTLTYSILSGNTNGAFVINTSTGALNVANSSALNFVTNPTFTMIVKVQDNGTGSLSSTATITVNLTNTIIVNGYPIIANQSFNVSRSVSNGTVVGTVIASDPNAGQLITYSITSGNSSNAFSINSTSGKITVKNKWALKYRHTPFLLTIKVMDNGTPSLSSQATITINII